LKEEIIKLLDLRISKASRYLEDAILLSNEIHVKIGCLRDSRGELENLKSDIELVEE
jgi:hypothetical protein